MPANKRSGRRSVSALRARATGGRETKHSSQEKDGWIIEGDACYWSGCGLGKASFTKVRPDALRFLRKFDADVAKEKLLADWAFALRVVPYAPAETQLPRDVESLTISTAP
jgi:hypothetical protein